MRRLGFLSLIVLTTLWVSAGPVAAAPVNLSATMTAEEEMPPGPAGAKGTAALKADPDTGEVCYKLTYNGPGKPGAAHIHKGAKGLTGGVVIDLKIAEKGLEACVPADPAAVKAVVADPAGHYVNIHTADYPAGAVRGQLSPQQTAS